MKCAILFSLLASSIFAAPVEVKVDFASPTGPVKPVNGVGQPPILGWTDFHLFHYLKEAGIPYSRLHDVGGAFGKGVYVDIPNLFRDFDADETKEENYDFAFTDRLIKALVENGVEPYFRLGVTIENRAWLRAYRIFPPKDYAKWARICEHVIRHYTEGWAKGFTYKITHWEIWNEPENSPNVNDNPMWRGTFSSFVDFYLVASRHLKAKFPHLMIGGYGNSGLYAHARMKAPEGANVGKKTWHFIACFTNFLDRAEREKAPLDFFSWHTYGHPDGTRKMAEFARRELDRHGYAKTQISVNEWLPEPTPPKGTPGHPKLGTAHQAALIAAQLVAFHDAPVDDAEIYDAKCAANPYSPLFNPMTHQPYKAYKVFLAFNELRKLGTAVKVVAPQKGVWALAAVKGGDGAVLLVNISDGDAAVNLKAKGWAVESCLAIGEKHDYEAVSFGGTIAKDDVLLLKLKEARRK